VPDALISLESMSYTMIIALIKLYNYSGEARARDYVNAGIARKSLDHAGTVKRNACFEFINIEIVKQIYARY